MVFTNFLHPQKQEKVEITARLFPLGNFIALKLEIAPEWHIYWENPGDTGIKTSFSWELPDGWELSEPEFQYPSKFESDGLVSYGYEKEVLYLFRLKIPDGKVLKETLEIKVTTDWLACKEICVPGESKAVLEVTPEIRQLLKKENSFDPVNEKFPQNGDNIGMTGLVLENSIIIGIERKQLPDTDYSKIEFFPMEQGVFSTIVPPRISVDDNKIIMELALDPMHTKIPDTINALFYNETGWGTSGNHKAIKKSIKLTNQE